jgi:hypothetical protein
MKARSLGFPFLITSFVGFLSPITNLDAKTETFSERRFSIAYPDNWVPLPKGSRDLINVTSPDGSASLFVTGFRLPGDGGDEMKLEFRKTFLTSMIVKGWHVTGECTETISGIDFKTIKAQIGLDNAVFFETTHGNEFYLIRETLKGGFPRLDPQLQEIIESFKFL